MHQHVLLKPDHGPEPSDAGGRREEVVAHLFFEACIAGEGLQATSVAGRTRRLEATEGSVRENHATNVDHGLASKGAQVDPSGNRATSRVAAIPHDRVPAGTETAAVESGHEAPSDVVHGEVDVLRTVELEHNPRR